MKVCCQSIKIYPAPKCTSFQGMIIYYPTKDSKFHQIKWRMTLVRKWISFILYELQLNKTDYSFMENYTSSGACVIRWHLQNTPGLIQSHLWLTRLCFSLSHHRAHTHFHTRSSVFPQLRVFYTKPFKSSISSKNCSSSMALTTFHCLSGLYARI